MINNQSILIIGSNSFLGRSLSEKISAKGNYVKGVYHKNKDNLLSKIDHISINEIEALNEHFDVVYLVSAFVPDNLVDANIQILFNANVSLVKKVCQKFKRSKIVYCSSVSVYENNDQIISENSNINPQSEYAISKLWGENIIANHDQYAIVRIASMYGVGMRKITFLPKILSYAINDKKITLFGTGQRKQNYIHVHDVANYLIAASTNDENRIYLATSRVSISNIEVADIIKAQLPETSIDFKGNDFSKSFHYNNSITIDNLGIEAKKELNIELGNLIKWMKKK